MNVYTISALKDNYSYIIKEEETNDCIIIDGVGFNECNDVQL